MKDKIEFNEIDEKQANNENNDETKKILESDNIIDNIDNESSNQKSNNTIGSSENDFKEDEMKERKELYNAFKKESLKDKMVNFFFVDETNKEEKSNESGTFFKNCIYGFIVGLLISVLYTQMFSIRSWISPLENIDDVTQRLNEINYIINKKSLYEKDDKEVLDMISLGMMASLNDKYAAYYTKEDLENTMQAIKGEYVGIGATVVEDYYGEGITITAVYENSPAFKAGVKPGEKVIAVDGKSINGLKVDQVVALVKGKAGSEVEITTLTNENIEKKYTITREKVEIPEVTGKMLDNNIGYIKIMQFEGKAYKQFLEYQNEFISKDIKGLIIDLRDNPGGSLDVLKNLSNIFIDNNVITYFEYKNGEKEIYRTLKGSWDIPVVILINGYSASASEAFAGALQDYGIATLVGTETYGKGLVQDIQPLSDGAAIKLTVAKYFTPKGRNFDDEGIKPDIEIEPLKDENGKEVIGKEDIQLNKAIEVMNQKLSQITK